MRNHLLTAYKINVTKLIPAICTILADTVEALYTKLLLQLSVSKNNLDQEILRRIVNQQVVD